MSSLDGKSLSFAKYYHERYNKNALEGERFLEQVCSVQVHHYGVDENGNPIYTIDGEPHDGEQSPVKFEFENIEQYEKSNLTKVLENGPLCNRWIDVDCINGDIIESLLKLVGCHSQTTFNNVVDPKQRVMGILLDDDSTKFLLVTKIATLTKEAVFAQENNVEGDVAFLFNPTSDGIPAKIISYETTSYLLIVPKLSKNGTLITIQHGNVPGDVFGDARESLKDHKHPIRSNGQGITALFMTLVKDAVESALSVERYMEVCVDQLEEEFVKCSDSLELINHARRVDRECILLRRNLQPFTDTLLDLTSSPLAETWGLKTQLHNMATVQKRISENM